MSRFDSDLDYREWLNGSDTISPNATCADCGAEFSRAAHDVGQYCDTCSDQREAWATAYALRMVKASLAASRPVVVDVALVPQSPDAPVGLVVDVALVPVVSTALRHPVGYLAWLDALRLTAKDGTVALTRAWYASPSGYQQHLLHVGGDLWITLKAIAARRAA